jgi:hypothetical protein
MRSRTIIFSFLFLCEVACTRSFQTYDVQKLHADPRRPLDRDYMFYSLPRTVITADIPVIKTIRDTDGGCTDKAFDDLRSELLLDQPTANLTFKLGKPLIGTRSEPDPDHVYAVDIHFRPFALTSGSFEMTDNGVLTTETVSQEDHSIDAVLAAAKIALAATGVTPAAAAAAAAAAPPGSTTTSPARKGCEQTAAQIKDVRTRRLALISESLRSQNPTEAALTAALAKFDDVEETLSAQFTGETVKQIATIQCDLRPLVFDTSAPNSGTKLFDLQLHSGVKLADAPCVIPQALILTATETELVKELAKNAKFSDPSTTVRSRIVSDGSQYAEQVKSAQRLIDDTARGFYYRIPGTAIVTIEAASDVRARQIMNIAQLGAVAALPTVGGAFVRKASMSPTLNAAGGLSKLTLNGEPAGNAAITGVGDLLASVQSAEAQKKKADGSAKDELTQLARQRQILEEQEKIAKLKKSIADLNGGGQP